MNKIIATVPETLSPTNRWTTKVTAVQTTSYEKQFRSDSDTAKMWHRAGELLYPFRHLFTTIGEDYIKDRKVELLPEISKKLRTSLKLIESITQEINLLSKKKPWKGSKRRISSKLEMSLLNSRLSQTQANNNVLRYVLSALNHQETNIN